MKFKVACNLQFENENMTIYVSLKKPYLFKNKKIKIMLAPLKYLSVHIFIPTHFTNFPDLCADVHCPFGARCENGNCVCPQDCAGKVDHICASDQKTYANECEMRRQACTQGSELEVVHSGPCDDESIESGGRGYFSLVCHVNKMELLGPLHLI